MMDIAREARAALAREWLLQEDGPVHIKLCGMSREEDVAAVNDALPDMVGFVCDFPKSHRNVSSARMGQLAGLVDERVYTVGVSVDLSFGRVGHNARRFVDMVQLHGNEDNDYIAGLRTRMVGGIIQAFRIRSRADVRRALASAADMVLLDAGAGTGRSFDWSLVEGFAERRPFILAGGLTPDNVGDAIDYLHPWGVDMSSGIETNDLKDPDKIRATVAAVRRTDG